MKLKTLREIIKKKEAKSEFAIVTNLASGESEIFETDKPLNINFEKHRKQIDYFYIGKSLFCCKITPWINYRYFKI